MFLLLLNILLSPWTKVEESFNVQAIHDFIFHTGSLEEWDHHSFPGVVPRTFTGALVLYILGSPIYMLFGLLNLKKVWYLIGARSILAILTWISSYGFYSIEFLLMEVSSFHMNFWGSRTIPNTFANIFTNFAFFFQSRGGSKNGLISLTLFVFTAVVFRAEVGILGICLKIK